MSMAVVEVIRRVRFETNSWRRGAGAAEVAAFDLNRLNDAMFAAIRAAWLEHMLC